MKKEETVRELVKKAERSLAAAKKLLAGGDYDFSVSRAYYAMFYCAQALLFQKDLSFSKHSAVISAFGKEFSKTGELPLELHRYLLDAFDDRLQGDYEIIFLLSEEKAKITLKRAKEFLEETKNYLKL